MVTKWPSDGQLKLPGLKNKLTRAYLLSDAAKSALAVDNAAGTKIVRVTDKASASPVTVVVAEYAGPFACYSAFGQSRRFGCCRPRREGCHEGI